MERGKTLAAMAAAELVKDGMGVGLGSGSTAAEFVRLLGEKVRKERLRIDCVPTSEDTRLLALKVGLRVVGLDEVKSLDLAVDGADAVDKNLNLIKGGGGCHAREKVVAYAAKKFVCIVDESKLRATLDGVPVPVEVLPFACSHVARTLEKSWNAKVSLRQGSGKAGPAITDNGNYIIDAVFVRMGDPCTLERELACIPGAVANGIFAARKPVVIVGRKNKAEVFRG